MLGWELNHVSKSGHWTERPVLNMAEYSNILIEFNMAMSIIQSYKRQVIKAPIETTV